MAEPNLPESGPRKAGCEAASAPASGGVVVGLTGGWFRRTLDSGLRLREPDVSAQGAGACSLRAARDADRRWGRVERETVASRGGRTPSGAGEGAVNGFHVHAVGWVLTANAFSLKPPEARELSLLWDDLLRDRADDLARAPLLARLLVPRSIPLSEDATKTFAALLERMAALYPERFGVDALRSRRNSWGLQAILGFVACGLARTFLPDAWPLVDAIVPTLFIMGCGALLPTIMLWRTAAAVQYCNTHRHAPASAVHRLARRS